MKEIDIIIVYEKNLSPLNYCILIFKITYLH